jgi:hypothetical protein
MTPILFSKIATSFGFAPTAKSVGPPLERADVATLLKQTVAGRGSLDFGADRRDYEGAAVKPFPPPPHARGTLRRVGRADAAGIEVAKEPKDADPVFQERRASECP